jgi:hypothetical protein
MCIILYMHQNPSSNILAYFYSRQRYMFDVHVYQFLQIVYQIFLCKAKYYPCTFYIYVIAHLARDERDNRSLPGLKADSPY